MLANEKNLNILLSWPWRFNWLSSKTNTSELLQQLTTHLTKLTESHNNKLAPEPSRTPYPDWMVTPPHNVTEVSKFMNDRNYVRCTNVALAEDFGFAPITLRHTLKTKNVTVAMLSIAPNKSIILFPQDIHHHFHHHPFPSQHITPVTFPNKCKHNFCLLTS